MADLLGTNLKINQGLYDAYNLDTVLLADFVSIPYKAKRVIDFGTGSGALLLYLSLKTNANLVGIEIQESRANQAKENIILNGLESRTNIILGDIKEAYKKFEFADVVVSNPPFFKVNDKTKINDDLESSIARHEILITIEDIIESASKILKTKGKLFLVHRPERVFEISKKLFDFKFSIKKIRFVHPYKTSQANHVLIEAVKDGKEDTLVLEPLIIYDDKSVLSSEAIRIFGKDIINL